MKWDNEKIKKLKYLISIGKKYEEISDIFNVSKKSISNKCFNLGLKIVSYKKYSCKNCEKEFYDLIKSDRKFCSNSCAASFNNSKRSHSDCTKEKLRLSRVGKKMSQESIEKISGKNSPKWKDGSSIQKRVLKVDGKRKCKYCKEFNVSEKKKQTCEDCKYNYYKIYRPMCDFKFDILSYGCEFDLKLVEQHGWYSPSNKGNNILGISKDHMYSVKDGFINKVDVKIVSHPANCKLMIHSENSSKNFNSTITLEELKNRICEWDVKYKLT